MIETTISFEGGTGSIIVQGAPDPLMPCYRVDFGQVALTEAQAKVAATAGWTIVLGRGNGELAIVERSEKEYWDYVNANLRQCSEPRRASLLRALGHKYSGRN